MTLINSFLDNDLQSDSDLKLDGVCFVRPHCLYGQQGVKLSWWRLTVWLCTHVRHLKETGELSSGWKMYKVACVRIMKNVQVYEYCLRWYVCTLWKNPPKQQKRTSPQVLLRGACAHIMKKFTLTLDTLICKLIIIKLMVAVVMLFIFICPFIFIWFVSPG